MKNFLLLVMLLLAVSIQCSALGTIRNNTMCRLDISIRCYDLCVLVNSTSFNLAPGQTYTHPSNFCNSSNFLVVTVCWNPGGPCGAGSVPCATIDASNPTAPSPCSPGTFSAPIVACDACINGVTSNVTYSTVTDNIVIQ